MSTCPAAACGLPTVKCAVDAYHSAIGSTRRDSERGDDSEPVYNRKRAPQIAPIARLELLRKTTCPLAHRHA